MSIKGIVDGIMNAVGVVPSVDRTKRALTDGSPVTEDHREIGPDGMQRGYIVLTDEERARGLQRPVRMSYVHDKCGAETRMNYAIAETYARDPKFYTSTYCIRCCTHLPVGENGEFTWSGETSKVGT